MSAAGAVLPVPGLRPSALTSLRKRPALAAEAMLAVAWIAMIAIFIAELIPHRGRSGFAMWWCTPAGSGAGQALRHDPSLLRSIAAGLPMWGLMSAAMMLPAAIPSVHHVAVNSLRWRRGRAVAQFLAVYLGLWLAFGVLVLALFGLLPSVRNGASLALALALAAAWQLTLPKRRALFACHRTTALPPRGWRATAGVLRFGRRNGLACLGSCWAMMLVMAVATAGQLFWAVALTGLISVEKLVRRPRRATRRTAALLGVAALGAVVFVVS